MSKKSSFENLVREASKRITFWRSLPLRQFREGVLALKPENMTLDELAKKAGVKRPQLSRWFTKNENMTVDSMVKVAMALEARVHIHVAPKGKIVDWQEKQRHSGRSNAAVLASASFGTWSLETPQAPSSDFFFHRGEFAEDEMQTSGQSHPSVLLTPEYVYPSTVASDSTGSHAEDIN